MKFLYATLFFLFLITPLYSQLYKPVDTLNSKRSEVLNYLNSKTKELEREFRSFPVNDRRVIRRFARDRNDMFEELTKDNYLFFDEELEGYINGLLQKLAKENGIDGEHLRIFLSRDTSPNAYSLGDGNFVFTLSLLNRLENEDELNFIIAHELSHYHLDHLKKQIKERMLLVRSTEYRAKQRELKKSRYNRFSNTLEQYIELQYGNRSTRRLRELQADSLGLILFKKVAKNPYNAISALRKTDTLSPAEMLKIDLDVLKNHFSTPSLPFDERWTAGYDFSKYNYQTGKVNIFGIHKDSLSTHPELEERILNLKKIMPEPQLKQDGKIDDFMKLKEKIRFEDVYAHYCMEEYGRGIYLILQLQNFEDVTENQQLFYSYMLSLFYQKLADARRTFKFKRFVDDIDYVNFSEEYILFLTILDNLRSSELQEFSKKYTVN
jgi:Zn-dependent protease with chaperone function